MRAQSLRLTLGVLAFATSLQVGCKKKEEPQPTPITSSQPPAPEAPVNAPEGLLAELVMRSPDGITASLQRLNKLIPAKASPILGDVLHVDRAVAEEIDSNKPAYLVMARQGQAFLFTMSVAIKDPTKVKGLLAGRFDVSEETALEMTVYTAKTVPKTQILAVRRGYLLASGSLDALKLLAPYVTRTLPTRPLPSEEVVVTVPAAAARTVVHDGLLGILQESNTKRLATLLKAREAKASVGVYEAAAAFMARQNERTIDWLKDAGDLRIILTTKDGTLGARIDVAVPAEGPFAKETSTWSLGEAMPLLDIPKSALLAFSSRSSINARETSSKELVELAAATFPTDLGEAEKKALAGFFSGWDKARGDRANGALLYGGPKQVGLVMRVLANNPGELVKLLKDGATTLFKLKGVGAGLEREGIKFRPMVSETIDGRAVEVLTLTLPKSPKAKEAEAAAKEAPKEGDTAELVFGAGKEDVLIAFGVGGRALFSSLAGLKPEDSMASDSTLSEPVKAFGGGTSAAMLFLPSRLMQLASGMAPARVAPANDPLFAAIGKDPSGAYVSVHLSKGAVELAMGLLVKSMSR